MAEIIQIDHDPSYQELETANAMLTAAYTGVLDQLKAHRDQRPTYGNEGNAAGTIYIAALVDWRIEMETIVDGILERAGY